MAGDKTRHARSYVGLSAEGMCSRHNLSDVLQPKLDWSSLASKVAMVPTSTLRCSNDLTKTKRSDLRDKQVHAECNDGHSL